MNGHSGNRYAITQAIREIREELDEIVYFVNVWPGAGFGSETTTILKQEDGSHSCEMETSLALYLGQRVLMDKAEKWKPPKS
jgi:creatinine amidohydrolase/Fe(II)-dependent formamide hydrolase-like protein